jgi:heptosyltransferase-1
MTSKRVLVIKLSSMGDLMHALPALTDACSIWPEMTFDWVVDESFTEVPAWHPAVKNIFPSAHRRWKNDFWRSFSDGEFSRFYRDLNRNDYDVVIDAQSNIKSSFISLLKNGPVHGMDKASVAEQPAFLAYKHRHFIIKEQHAVQRQRQLFANALGYKVPETDIDYGLKSSAFDSADIQIKTPYLFFVHNASWTTKLWPEEYWHDLIRMAAEEGYQVVLPGGNKTELNRASAFAETHTNAIALPKLDLSTLGGLIKNSAGAFCCDTGLAHLAAMIGIPAVTMYGPTSKKLIGTSGVNQEHLVSNSDTFTCSPCYKRQCNFHEKNSVMSACMQAFNPESAWALLKARMSNK